jgi:hypothetical protein
LRTRLPIRKLWGPSLPIELVRSASPAAFEKSAAADLPQRLAHELGRLIPHRVREPQADRRAAGAGAYYAMRAELQNVDSVANLLPH